MSFRNIPFEPRPVIPPEHDFHYAPPEKAKPRTAAKLSPARQRWESGNTIEVPEGRPKKSDRWILLTYSSRQLAPWALSDYRDRAETLLRKDCGISFSDTTVGPS
jgi:hypothetical protein